MAIDLKYQTPKTVDEVNENINTIRDVAMHKQAVDIDTKTINTVFTDSDTEALRLVVLQLINNLKGT